MYEMPTVTLKCGIKVANFSSPHAFTFNDGSILGRCDPERVSDSSLFVSEKIVDQRGDPKNGSRHFNLMEVEHQLTDHLREMLFEAMKFAALSGVDVVIVPRVLLDAIASDDHPLIKRLANPTNKVVFATVRLWDRETKVNCSQSFCCARIR